MTITNRNGTLEIPVNEADSIVLELVLDNRADLNVREGEHFLGKFLVYFFVVNQALVYFAYHHISISIQIVGLRLDAGYILQITIADIRKMYVGPDETLIA